jgi:enoyl-CoA hydratase/carnithine racemase
VSVTYEVDNGVAWLTIDRPEARNALSKDVRDDAVVPAAELRTHTQALAERIAANAPLSVRASKRTAYLSADHSREAAYEVAEEIWAPVYRSADAQEGPAAFRDKRTPVWKGR